MAKPPPDRGKSANRRPQPEPHHRAQGGPVGEHVAGFTTAWGHGGGAGAEKMPLNFVRGGGLCDPKEKGGHIIRGSLMPAVCLPTPGPDPRARYRQAGVSRTPRARHSTAYLQKRKPGE